MKLNRHGLPLLSGSPHPQQSRAIVMNHPLDCRTRSCRAVATHQLGRAHLCENCYDRLVSEQIIGSFP